MRRRKDLDLGDVGVHAELRLADIGQPDLQVADATGAAIGYGETKVPGTGAEFASVLGVIAADVAGPSVRLPPVLPGSPRR